MVTISEIAKAVGVSNATVSRVLNFDSTLSVTAETRRAIIEKAEALNYETPRRRKGKLEPSNVGKILMLHFLSPDQELVDPYYVGLRLGVERRCQKHGLEIAKLYDSEQLPNPMTLRKAYGVIVVGPYRESALEWLASNCKRLVFADFRPISDEFDNVSSDLAQATLKLLHALNRMNYRRIAFIGWPESRASHPYSEVRCQTYIEWSKRNGTFDQRLCLVARNNEECGYELALKLMKRAKRPDVIITGSDNMAVGAYRALRELGIEIGKDVAIASFNDISVAQFMHPPLTTIRLPAEEIGETAVDMLMERAAGRSIGKQVTLASQLIWRGSTKKVQRSTNP